MTQVLILGMFASVAHVVMDTYHEIWAGVLIDIFLLGNLGVIYYLDRKRYVVFSRLYLIIFINLALYLVCTIVPGNYGVVMLFLPMVCLPFLLFEYARYYLRWMLSLTPVILFLTLETTGYYSIIPYRLSQGETYSYVLNFMSAAAIFYFIVDFLYKAHRRSENNLRDNQKRLKGLTIDMKHQNTQLEKANRELDRFVYSASHDLKAPLASIKGLIDLARRDQKLDKVDYLYMMEERVEHLEKFIFEITTYSRNSRQSVNPEYIWLPGLADEVIKGLRFMPGADLISLHIADELGANVYTDKYRLTIILNNLISNAIKYHNLDQEDPYIRLQFTYERGRLNISIEDNGEGIEPELINQIFEMFYRGTESSDGTGLGLYIAREVAEKLGGYISVMSTPGKGTSFTFSMPLEYMQPTNGPSREEMSSL